MERSDVWGFGCVLYEMLTGKRAFGADDVSDTLALVLKGEPDWTVLPPETPTSVRTLIRACLAKNRQERVADISSALFVLAHHSDLSSAVPPQPSSARIQVWKRLAIAAAVVLAAAVSAAGIWVATRADEPAATRFMVMPPENSVLVTGDRVGASVAISPNGRMLAFTARNSSGKVMVWLRPIDTLTAQPLAGTEGAQFPFWSPDSRFIAYFTVDKLLKVSTAGGSPQTLCAVALGRGGAWNQSGEIVYGVNGGPLFRVSSLGGQPSAVTRLATGVQDHRFPWFLPDGRHVLYYTTAPQGISGVYLATIDDGQTRRLVEGDTGAIFDAHDGYLLFGRQGMLMAQSFDVASLTPTGEAFPLSESLESGVYAGVLAFSVSNTGTLAYGLGLSRAGIRLARRRA